LQVTSSGESICITGDLWHHPAQCARPDWAEFGDYDRAQARETRRAFIDEHASRGTLLAGTHFPSRPVGRVHAERRAWRFEPES